MILNKLVLKNYRNFLGLTFDNINESINIISGKNAVGKTNLIESINYLSYGKSFRNVSDQKLICDGKDHAEIRGYYSKKNFSGKIEIKIIGDSKKSIRVDGLPVKKMSELFGNINTIVFSPDDLKIVKESPGMRRRLINIELSKISPSYYMNLKNYMAVLKEKNRVLKMNQLDEKMIETYNEQLASYGTKIMLERDSFISDMENEVSVFYNKFNSAKEIISLRYDHFLKRSEISENTFMSALMNGIERERDYGQSLIGPHRDDLEILIDGKDSKIYASQGQQRTSVLAIKLSILKIAEEKTGEKPILLLDDVFSELDIIRRNSLIEMIDGNQVFITTTEKEEFPGNISHYRIEEGQIIGA